MTKHKILVVEDEKDLVKLLRHNLEKAGYSVVSAGDAETGLKTARKAKPDLILLDVMLPKMDGLEFLRVLRGESQVPVIVVSAKSAEVDRIIGLKLGADDYVPKPFSVGELLARVSARLRRRAAATAPAAAGILAFGRLEVDLERHEVRVAGKPARLAPKEFVLLKKLIEADGKVLSRDHLLEAIWGVEAGMEIDTRTVDQHVARLRAKLGAESKRIATVPNFGYKLAR